ncbi:hypothetical protein HLB23_21025 [Nocardia uniformis]|uniref:Uncharacterized protein n=1 Tax=Nocardia uniformis TaxID=53432 RepID=A0A849C7D1_9NOCA|nr:hypothetical protein [Nocardia uniformis]NNH72310.1 hypothetical protein [Nocardia uniformis]
MNGDDIWQVAVLTGSGSLVTERLTRELRAHLESGGAQVRHQTAAVLDAGHKGGIGEELVLLVAAGASAGSLRLVATMVREWCALNRQRRVEMRLDGRSLVIEGNPKDQLAIVEEFFDSADGKSGTAETEES